MVMKFDPLSKESIPLKQHAGENVTEFRVLLSQQVQILQSRVPKKDSAGASREDKMRSFLQGTEH